MLVAMKSEVSEGLGIAACASKKTRMTLILDGERDGHFVWHGEETVRN